MRLSSLQESYRSKSAQVEYVHFYYCWKCPLFHSTRTWAILLGGKEVLYLTPLTPSPTQGLPGLLSREAWWIGTWLNSGTVPVSGVLRKRLYKSKLVQFYEGHQNTNRYLSNAGGLAGIFFLLFTYTAILSRQLELDGEPRPPTFSPDFGTNDPPLIVWRLKKYNNPLILGGMIQLHFLF